MHECSGQIGRRFCSFFGVCALLFSCPRLLPTGNFSRRSLCTTKSLGCTVHTGILPSDDMNHGCCRQHRTSPSSEPERLPPQLSCFFSLPALFFFPIVVIAASFFAHSCLHQIPLKRGFGLCSCHLCMPNYRSHSTVLVFLYDVTCCVRDWKIFIAASIAFSSFGVRQRNTSQVRFLGGHLVLCMCSFYVCTPYSFS